jgi:hypothetical protein
VPLHAKPALWRAIVLDACGIAAYLGCPTLHLHLLGERSPYLPATSISAGTLAHLFCTPPVRWHLLALPLALAKGCAAVTARTLPRHVHVRGIPNLTPRSSHHTNSFPSPTERPKHPTSSASPTKAGIRRAWQSQPCRHRIV